QSREPHEPHENEIMSNTHRIWLAPISLGARGYSYEVRYASGVLVASTRDPEFAAARALVARGMRGQLEVWREGGSAPSMGLDIEKAARLATREGDRDGLRFVAELPSSLVYPSSGPRTTAAAVPAGVPPSRKIGRSWSIPCTEFEPATRS